MFDSISLWSVNKKFWSCLSIVAIGSFIWLYIFLSTLNFNPAYGDDYRSLYYAKSHSFQNIFSFLLQPFSHDYYGKGWVEVRPVYYLFLKGIYLLFGSEAYWYYLWRVISGVLFLSLVYLFFYKATKNAFFSAATGLFILGLPSFYYTMRFIADQTHLALIFLMVALIFLLKVLDGSSLRNLVLFILSGYLSVKSKTDGKFLVPITASLFLFSRRSFKIFLFVVFFALICIPWLNLLAFPSLTEEEKTTSFVQYFINVVFQKKYTDFPFGYEPSFVLFSQIFPLSFITSGKVTIPFSFFSSLGPLFAWLFLLCSLCAVLVWLRRKVCLLYNSNVLVILLTWFVFASFLLAFVGTKVHDVELPKYVFSGMLPFSLLVFFLLHAFYVNIVSSKYKKVFLLIIAVLIVHHLFAGFFYQFLMRGAEGQQWFVFDQAVRSAIAHENKSGDFIDVLYETGEFDVIRRIIFEQYNFVIHSVLSQGVLNQLISEGRPFYFLDLRYVNSVFNDDKYLPADYEPVLVKEIFLPKDGINGLYVKFRYFMAGRDLSRSYFARLYLIQKRAV